MGRGGGAGRGGGGGGGGSWSGNGPYGNDGTITERQLEYVNNLLGQPNRIFEGPMGGVQAARAAYMFGTLSRLAEDDATERSMREFGPKLLSAAEKWAASIEPTKLSKTGASSLIDALRGGRVGAFVATFGGDTVAQRAKFMSKISGRKYVVKKNRRGNEEIWLAQ